MDYISFPTAFTGLLKQHNHTASSADILLAMEAPYLFLKRDGRYIAGTGFLTPEWLHLYLRPLGLQLTKHPLARSELGNFLKCNSPAILQLDEQRFLLVTSRSGQRICLVEKYTTLPTLLKHSPDQVCAYTLDACTPAATDYRSLLAESAQTLPTYAKDIRPLLDLTVTREDMHKLHPQYFRALMVGIPNLVQFYPDEMLQEHLRLLHHTYQHLFTIGVEKADLRERISKRPLFTALIWLRENILDRLYTLGASDELLNQCADCPNT